MEAMHVWRAKFDMLHAMFYIFMPYFIYLCHVLYIYALIYRFMQSFTYIYAMFYRFMPCFIYLCHVLYIYVMCYILMPCFIFLSQFQYMLHHYSFVLHQDFHFCCIVFSHLLEQVCSLPVRVLGRTTRASRWPAQGNKLKRLPISR